MQVWWSCIRIYLIWFILASNHVELLAWYLIRKTDYSIPNNPPGRQVNLCRIPYLHARFRSIFPSFSISEYASKIRLPAHRFLYLRPAEFELWFPYHSCAKQPAAERWFALYQLYIIGSFPHSAMEIIYFNQSFGSPCFFLIFTWGSPGRDASQNNIFWLMRSSWTLCISKYTWSTSCCSFPMTFPDRPNFGVNNNQYKYVLASK